MTWKHKEMVSTKKRRKKGGVPKRLVVSNKGGLSSGGLIRVVFQKDGLSSGWSFSGWSFIRVVFHWGGLSSGGLIGVVFQKDGLSSGVPPHHEWKSSGYKATWSGDCPPHRDTQPLQDWPKKTYINRAVTSIVPDLVHQIGQVGPRLHSILWQGLDGHGLGPCIDVGYYHSQSGFYGILDKLSGPRFPGTVRKPQNTNSRQDHFHS